MELRKPHGTASLPLPLAPGSGGGAAHGRAPVRSGHLVVLAGMLCLTLGAWNFVQLRRQVGTAPPATPQQPQPRSTRAAATTTTSSTSTRPQAAASAAPAASGDGQECPAGTEARGDAHGQGGCGSGCEGYGQTRCCTRAFSSAAERAYYDDVPDDVGFGRGDGPLPRPTHDATPLPVGKKREGAEVSRATCSGVWGDKVPVPSWLPPAWRRLHDDGALEPAAQRLEGGGSVLVTWVPSKFMRPQQGGRNVRGQNVDAPTRGTNNSYYLAEYKAAYHSEVADPATGAAFHTQLVARGALVVCLWERLHINLYNCTFAGAGGARAVIPWHFCQCRHCKDSVLGPGDEAASPVVGGASPDYTADDGNGGKRKKGRANALGRSASSNPFVSYEGGGGGGGGGGIGDANRNGLKCVDAASAPWLLKREYGVRFPYEGLHLDLKRLLEVQADRNGVVMFFIFNKFWVDHLHNVVYSLVHNAGVSNFVVATLDCESLELCLKNRLPCFNAEKFAESEADMKRGERGEAKGFQRKVTEELSWIKPRLALKVLSLRYQFLMVDMDMAFYKNPMQNVVTRSVDMAHQCDTSDKLSINTGFYLLKDNLRAQRLFENIMVFPPHRLSDQNALKLVSKYDHTHGASNACLDRWLYNMKCNYKVAKSEKVSGGVRSFQWKPQQRDRAKFDWYIFHATCLDGAIAKINWLRSSQAWFLDALDDATEESYCLV